MGSKTQLPLKRLQLEIASDCEVEEEEEEERNEEKKQRDASVSKMRKGKRCEGSFGNILVMLGLDPCPHCVLGCRD